MTDVYTAHKPLRNYLRKTELLNGLGAIRWYVNRVQLKNPQAPLTDMEVDPRVLEMGLRVIPPWQLGVLARELIINSEPYGLTNDLRRKRDFAAAMNKLKAIDEYISKEYVNQDNIHQLVSKVMSHAQFPWQENRPNHQTMTRYYYLYQHELVRPIFEDFFSVTVEQHFVLSMVAWNNYTEHLGMFYPPNLHFPAAGIDIKVYDNYIRNYALPLKELKEHLKGDERVFNENFLTYYDSLKKYPLVLYEDGEKPMHVCPVPTYFFWRTTDGIYYELFNKRSFDQAIGESFKTYIGEVIGQQDYRTTVTILDADSEIAKSLPKPDWIIISGSSAAFIECKTKRMTINAKTEVDPLAEATSEQLGKLAEGIIQCYKAIADAQNRSYTWLKKAKRFFPVVVTLESWYVLGDTAKRLDAQVKKKAQIENIDSEILEKHPYLALSSLELENLAVVLRKHSVEEVIEPYFRDEFEGWQFDTYLAKRFKREVQYSKLLKENIFDVAVDEIIKKSKVLALEKL